MFIEDSQTELKEIYTEDIKKELIAFLNTHGGVLYVGISDKGEVIGLVDADKVRIAIDNIICAGIYPIAHALAHTEVIAEPLTGKQYVKCTISEGIEKPYHYKHSRLTPESVFIRVGSSCVSADDSIIGQMLRDSRKSYESLISVQQGLSFAYADDIFSKAGIAFGEAQKVSLKLKTNTGLYTNLGLLLSDQCPHFIKAAAFRDSDGFDFIVKNDFVGSVLMQLESAYSFAISHINQKTKYEGLRRIDAYDYPLVAIREALLNAIMHRDYSSSSPTQFKIFSDRIELVSFGGLLQELSKDPLAEGISACRNPNLAAVLVLLGLVESFGTGIPKIIACYKQASEQPVFTVKPNLFKITIPKLTDDNDSPKTAVFK